jgi:hypothetical protein
MSIDEHEMNRRLIALAEYVGARFWHIDYDTLSRPERVFRAIWELEAQVNNGGFAQYFRNSSGELALEVADALRAVGAASMAAIVEQALEMVGRDVRWNDDNARIAHIENLPTTTTDELEPLDQQFISYPDNLTVLLYQYVSEHRDEMRAPANF